MPNTPQLDKLLEKRRAPSLGAFGGVDTPELDKLMGKTPVTTDLTVPSAFVPKPKVEEKKLSKWQWISKQLMKPVGIVAAEVEAFGRFIGEGRAYIPGKPGLDVLSGKREYSFADMWGKYAPEVIGISEGTARKIGFVFDIADDPLNFIGIGGLTKIGKISQKVTSLTKAGKTVKASSKLGKEIAKHGYKIDDLVLAGSRIEQAQKGQRALLGLRKTPWSPITKPLIKGEKFFAASTKLSQITRASKIGGGLRRTFSTKTGLAEVDEMVESFNNLAAYRKQQVVDEAVDIQKGIKKFSTAQTKLVVEAIENPALKNTITDKNVIKIADRMEGLFKQMKVTEKAKGVLKTELENYFPHIKAQGSLTDRIKFFFNPKKYSTALKAAKQRKIPGTVGEINARFGKEFFQSNPALSYAQRGLASAKAVTAREFIDEMGKKFFVNAENAPMSFIKSTNPLYKGLKAEPEIVNVVDQYIQGIQPDNLRLIVRAYDKTLSWWKAQVLISPSYHMRNMFSNFWNNWLAGIKNPVRYEQARRLQWGNFKKASLAKINFITDAGDTIGGTAMLKEAKKRGVMGRGWYGADIQRALGETIGGTGTRAKLQKLMPWKQENVLFKTNRAVGSAIEDNARLAHFIDKVVRGFSYDDAARSVKKFLFDYADLTATEKTLFKRVFPFYTWTRKNIPLQLENMIIQPEMFAAVPKVIREIEAGVVEPRTEKYLSKYITDNVPVRIRTTEKGITEYFLLGNWLPSAQAIDFLSQPFENIINMASPAFKVPYELWANKSLFFRNTLGENSKIEYYYKQPVEFLGVPMRRKTSHLMRNIRIFNDLNKLFKTPAKDEPENTLLLKGLNVLFGKAAAYDIKKARYFYERETQERISELEAAIRKAKKMDEKEHAKELQEELKAFRKERRL